MASKYVDLDEQKEKLKQELQAKEEILAMERKLRKLDDQIGACRSGQADQPSAKRQRQGPALRYGDE